MTDPEIEPPDVAPDEVWPLPPLPPDPPPEPEPAPDPTPETEPVEPAGG